MLNNNYPIDMVYLWCDGNDPAFAARKNYYQEKEGLPKSDSSRTGQARFFDNDELKYSLRSLEMYVPWISHVFIVTDRQCPKWLNINNPKVTLIDHSEILPSNLIPCFNSSVIEAYIWRIPGLSEHFLYGNDDMFFYKPLSPDFFFTQGKPIARLKFDEEIKKIRNSNDFKSEYTRVALWYKNLMYTWKLLYLKYGKFNQFEAHHNIDGYLKSSFFNTYLNYKESIEKNASRFRAERNIDRCLFSLDPVYNGASIPKLLHKPHHWRKKIAPFIKLNLDSLYAEDTPQIA